MVHRTESQEEEANGRNGTENGKETKRKGRRKTKNHTLLKRLGKLRSNNEKTPKEKEKKKEKMILCVGFVPLSDACLALPIFILLSIPPFRRVSLCFLVFVSVDVSFSPRLSAFWSFSDFFLNYCRLSMLAPMPCHACRAESSFSFAARISRVFLSSSSQQLKENWIIFRSFFFAACNSNLALR